MEFVFDMMRPLCVVVLGGLYHMVFFVFNAFGFSIDYDIERDGNIVRINN